MPMKTPKNRVINSRRGSKTNHSMKMNPIRRLEKPNERATTIVFGFKLWHKRFLH
jgi:hypothetical protein